MFAWTDSSSGSDNASSGNEAVYFFMFWTPSGHAFRGLPEFRDFLRKSGLTDLWDKYGAPDVCHKQGADYVCD